MLFELETKNGWQVEYDAGYDGPPVSLTMPVRMKSWFFEQFPPFFEGVLPEGIMLEGLLQGQKIDREDYFSQLMAVGNDLVGAVTVQQIEGHE